MTLLSESVPLSDIISLERRPVRVAADGQYAEIGIYSYGRGIFHKLSRSGLEVGDKALFDIKTGDFILQITFAWEGAVALASEAEDGMYGSVRFPTFRIDESRCFPRFLVTYFRTPEGRDQLVKISPGSAGRNRVLSLKRLSEVTVPLPPLDEQLRIVARIEDLAARIEEARGLRREAVEQAELLMSSEEMKVWPDQALDSASRLQDITTYLSRGRQSEQGESDHFLIKTQHVQMARYVPTQMTLAPHVAFKVSSEALATDGDILIACSAAGCLGRVAQFADSGRPASTDTHVAIARPDRQAVLPEYLYAYLRGAQGQRQLRSRERGDWTREKIGFRLTELNLADLRNVPVPVPSSSEQASIVEYLSGVQRKVDELKSLQRHSAAELDALLPSVLDRAFKGEL